MRLKPLNPIPAPPAQRFKRGVDCETRPCVSPLRQASLAYGAALRASKIAPGDFVEPGRGAPWFSTGPPDAIFLMGRRPIRKMVEGGGFEPPKAEPADLQSAPFGHSGTPPARCVFSTRPDGMSIAMNRDSPKLINNLRNHRILPPIPLARPRRQTRNSRRLLRRAPLVDLANHLVGDILRTRRIVRKLHRKLATA